MVIAPMSGVTDDAFRLMFLKYGRPDVFWTEFASADGLFSRGKKFCLKVLEFNKAEKPIVAQLFGSDPVYFEKAAALAVELGFDGVDINMGCPDRAIERKGCGSALIKTPQLAGEIIRAAKRGASAKASATQGRSIPVSVKTRIGYEKNQITEWIPVILKEKPAVLTVHFRSRDDGYYAPANWKLAKEIIKLRNKYSPKTLIIGNGDVKTFEQAKKLAKENELDGIMIGRAVVGNPWFFAPRSLGGVGLKHIPSVKERLNAVIEHAEIFDSLHKDEKVINGHYKKFESLKKHFHAYTKGFYGAKDLRDQLMQTKNSRDVKKLIEDFLKDYKVHNID